MGVGVATFGEKKWEIMGSRAMTSSAVNQGVLCMKSTWRTLHGETLGDARNEVAAVLSVSSDYIVFLDADDRLSPGYMQAMYRKIRDHKGGPAIFRPSTLGVYEGGLAEDDAPVLIPRTNMANANCIVIGAACPLPLFEDVGGFDVNLPALEDWDLWIRMILAGAEVVDVPEAVYRVGVTSDSRNKRVDSHARAYRTIRGKYGRPQGLDIR